MQIPNVNKQALLGKTTSQQNKVWLATGWSHFNNWYIDYKWVGKEFKSRMLFQFEPDGEWIQADSFEEDVLTKYKFSKEIKK